jgi:transcriptional regulator with XRE-family HTH domain
MTSENPFAKQRAEIKKTQRQIADELGITGQTVSGWETGKFLPGPADYDRVAAAYQRDRTWVVESVMQLDSVAA